jgi:molybdate transport repressor ModE-like protein
MKISHVAGLITAGREGADAPLKMLGDASAITRVVLTLKEAGVFPIVVVTGAQTDEVRYELAHHGVVFLEHETPLVEDQFSSIRRGCEFLEGKADRVVVAPVNMPLFTSATVAALMATPGEVVSPSYQGTSGHPVVLDAALFPEIASYSGKEGLRAVLHAHEAGRVRLPVEDAGVLAAATSDAELTQLIQAHSQALVHPHLTVELCAERSFLDARTKLLLFLLDDVANMRRAAAMMALSYSKAWNLVNTLEAGLNVRVVERKQGGRQGGNTHLTPLGRELLLSYQQYEEALYAYAQELYHSTYLASLAATPRS